MWKKFKISLKFENRLCASVPQCKELVRPWLEARAAKKMPDAGPDLDEMEKEVIETIDLDEEVEKTTLNFQRDDKGLFVRGGTFKAHLKDCANQVKDVLKIKALRAKVANKVYIDEYRIYLRNGGSGILQESHGAFDQPVHVMTAMGPRNALKNINYVKNASMEFTLKILSPDKEVTPDIVEKILEYGAVHGYGGERGMGEGRYSFTIKELG